MIAKIIDKEHIPYKTTVIAGTGHVIESTPDRSISYEGCYFPENEQS